MWGASRRYSALLVGMAVVSGAVAAILPLAGIRLIDAISPKIITREAMIPLVLIALASVVEHGLELWRRGLLQLLGFDIRFAAEELIVQTTTSVELEAFEEADFYDGIERASRAAMLQPIQLAGAVLSVVTAAAGGLGTAVAVISLEPRLFLPALVPFLPIWWIAQRRATIQMRWVQEATPTERLASYFTSVLTERDSAKEIRIFEAARYFDRLRQRALHQRSGEIRREIAEIRRAEITGNLGFALANLLTWGVVIALVARGVGATTQVLVFIYAFQRLKGFLVSLSWGVAQAAEAAELMTDIDGLDRWQRVADTPAESLAPLSCLSVSSVGFCYPLVAIVGPNGSGKSTSVKLLSGLLTPQAGQLAWNGSPVSGTSLRSRTSVVFQDSSQFAVSMAENVSLGREGPDPVQSIEEVGLGYLVKQFPNGVQTVLSRQFEGGMDLSGGQWQRLMIARGIYDDACEILVMDEASAALDPVAENDLVQQVKRLCRNKVVVVVSHRLSSIMAADRILVMIDGSIVEEGTASELLNSEGHFAEMFNLQARALGVVRDGIS